MTSLISYLANRTGFLAVWVAISLCACASMRAPANEAAGIWTPSYEVVPKLVLESLVPDKGSPQAAEMTTVWWRAQATGGVGSRTYRFRIFDGKSERTVQSGPSAVWGWKPRRPGKFRVKAVVTDSLGNEAETDWSPEYEIGSALGRKDLIAVMPLENLAAAVAPVEEIRGGLLRMLKAQGLNILEESRLGDFMKRHRVRYVGGLSRELGKAFREESGTRAVLFVSLDLYEESYPPKIAFHFRLVSTGERISILWMDSVAIAGNDAPGILGLGLVHDPRVLRDMALKRMTTSLEDYLTGKRGRGSPETLGWERDKFQPKESFRSPHPLSGKLEPVTIAVLPFLNESTRRNAGEIMALHIVRALSALENVEVLEPGVVRQELLTSRTIMEQGLSLAQADLLRVMLEVDLVVSGNVMDYQDGKGYWGNPKVDFLARVIDVQRRQAVWVSFSYNRGDDGVFFFDVGKFNTTHSMGSGMARGVAAAMLRSREHAEGAHTAPP